VSSSAQLALLPWLAGWEPPADRTRFAAGLHAGSTAGLALALRDDLASLRPAEARRFVLSAAPAAVAGLLLQDVVERRLGGPRRTAALMAASAAALWVADRQGDSGPRASRDRGKELPPLGGADLPRSREVDARDVTMAALAQVAALAPGVSRTGVTLTALRARGVDREQALRTSLLMSIPVTVGAAGLTAVRGRARPPLVPTALAAGTAYATARRVPSARTVVATSVAYRLVLAAAVAVRRAKERG
jgi:undecaprenyl-diphosphatase